MIFATGQKGTQTESGRCWRPENQFCAKKITRLLWRRQLSQELFRSLVTSLNHATEARTKRYPADGLCLRFFISATKTRKLYIYHKKRSNGHTRLHLLPDYSFIRNGTTPAYCHRLSKRLASRGKLGSINRSEKLSMGYSLDNGVLIFGFSIIPQR